MGIAVKALDRENPLNRTQTKVSITDAIARVVVGADRDEIAQLVEEEYERLLKKAAIVTYIPALTAGLVRRKVAAHNMRREA